MIRYSYNNQIQPPAPFVFVTLRNAADGGHIVGVPAQIDTAADQTVLPEELVHSLGLPQMGVTLIAGLGGITQTLPTYVVLLAVHDLQPLPIKVIASTGELWILLGRDVVNVLRLVLDGPAQALEIG